jgi:mannose-6-phosphate isomerase-like protein (cupin superfamily)
MKMNLQPVGKIQKGWGFEVVWTNNDDYSGKILVFERAGSQTSLVFHKTRKKSWFINQGRFKLTFCDLATGEMKETVLEEGRTVDFAELSPHRLESLVDNGMIFEVGTTDYTEDRFRLSPGDTQKTNQ